MKEKSIKRFNFRIFYIILASLVVLSFTLFVVFKTTGAWFTDSASSEDTSVEISFGSVALSGNFVIENHDYSGGTVVETAVVKTLSPTQTIKFKGNDTADSITYSGTVDAFYRFTYEITDLTDLQGNALTNGVTISSLSNFLKFNTGSQLISADKTKIYGKVSPEETISCGTLLFDKSAGNQYANIKFKINVKLHLVQTANLSSIIADTTTMNETKYNTLFNTIFA